jgi:hypothetical protein
LWNYEIFTENPAANLDGFLSRRLHACRFPPSFKTLDSLIPVDATQVAFSDDWSLQSLETAIDRSIRFYEGRGRNNVYQDRRQAD